jgi:hypothetical protein
MWETLNSTVYTTTAGSATSLAAGSSVRPIGNTPGLG